MANYKVKIINPKDNVFGIKVQKVSTGKEIELIVSGDEIAAMIIGQNRLNANLEPRKEIIEAFNG